MADGNCPVCGKEMDDRNEGLYCSKCHSICNMCPECDNCMMALRAYGLDCGGGFEENKPYTHYTSEPIYIVTKQNCEFFDCDNTGYSCSAAPLGHPKGMCTRLVRDEYLWKCGLCNKIKETYPD
jgi:hypothetical protein